MADKYQRRGVGTALMDKAEQLILEKGYAVAGWGRGNTAYYSAAQRIGCGQEKISASLGCRKIYSTVIKSKYTFINLLVVHLPKVNYETVRPFDSALFTVLCC